MEDYKKCPICNNNSTQRLTKESVDYFQCHNCKTLFSGALDNDNLIGGTAEFERNTQQNYLRIERVKMLCAGEKVEDMNILDFGCGNGMLIEDLGKEGFNCDGYDAYNSKYSRLPDKNKYHIITAIEVIEHTSEPYVEIDVMYRSLKENGVLMVETSFIDVAAQENIELEDFFYVSPKAGHSTIFSHHGLDLIMALKGFTPLQHFNRHVRVFLKKSK